jgi:Fe-S-cluster containining protein
MKSGIHAGSQDESLPAGSFSSWLDRMRRSQKTGEGMDVQCGGCIGCCSSSYFIHIRPDEKSTLAVIPKGLMFPAPGMPKGNIVLGYDQNGYCPMMKNNKCVIYDHRPATCRNYDCRIFTATGFSPGEERPVIANRAGLWRFDLSGVDDIKKFRAVRRAAGFIREHAGSFPAGFIPDNIPRQAMLAIKTYEIFLDSTDETVYETDAEACAETAKKIVYAFEEFEKADSV